MIRRTRAGLLCPMGFRCKHSFIIILLIVIIVATDVKKKKKKKQYHPSFKFIDIIALSEQNYDLFYFLQLRRANPSFYQLPLRKAIQSCPVFINAHLKKNPICWHTTAG